MANIDDLHVMRICVKEAFMARISDYQKINLIDQDAFFDCILIFNRLDYLQNQ